MSNPNEITLTAASAAVCTLQKLGYTFEGGALWKPPLGGAPAFTKPYTEWRRGDVLRVVQVDRRDRFTVGDLVTHDDRVGDRAPMVTGTSGRFPMDHEQLEFVLRPA